MNTLYVAVDFFLILIFNTHFNVHTRTKVGESAQTPPDVSDEFLHSPASVSAPPVDMPGPSSGHSNLASKRASENQSDESIESEELTCTVKGCPSYNKLFKTKRTYNGHLR